MSKRIIVRGPALSASGYGEQTRYALRALKANQDKFDIYLDNLSWGKTGWILPNHPEREWLDFLIGKTANFVQQGGTFDVSLQVTIPNEWQKLAPVNVGYTAGIETTKISPEWIMKANEMDSVIVISEHSRQGFENTEYHGVNQETGEQVFLKTTTPVHSVNYCVRDWLETEKVDLNLPTSFNFLTVAQWGIRKNLESTIVNFLREFKDDENVGLIVKTSIAKNSTGDRLFCEQRLASLKKLEPDSKCKVYLLHGDMTDEEMKGLYTNPTVKALVSTTHGEGFGFPLFEAAIEGLPVIAPSWSGQVDFLYAQVTDKKTRKKKNKAHFLKLDYDLGPVQKEAVWPGVIQEDSQWCYVKDYSVRAKMRELYKTHDMQVSIARKLQNHIMKNFTPEKFNREFIDSMGLDFKESESMEDWLNQLKSNIVEYD